MAKKNSLFKYIRYVAALFGLVAVFMVLCPAINYTVGDNTVTYSGLQVAFGYTETTTGGILSVSIEQFKFSFMALLAYALPLAGVVIAALNSFGRKSSKLLSFVSTGCFIVGAVFMFSLIGFAIVGESTVLNVTVASLNKDNMTLGIGAIIGAIASIIAAAGEAADLFLNK